MRQAVADLVAALQAAGFSTSYAIPSLRVGEVNVTVAPPDTDELPAQCPGAVLATVDVMVFARGQHADHLLDLLDQYEAVRQVCADQGWQPMSSRGATVDDAPVHILTIERPI